MDNTSIAAAFLEGLEQFDQFQLCTLDKTQADAVSNLKSVLKCLALTIYILLGMGTIFTCYHPGKIGPFLSQAVEAFTSALKIRFLCLFIKTDDIRAMMNFVDFLEYDEEGGMPWQMKWQFWFATDRGKRFHRWRGIVHWMWRAIGTFEGTIWLECRRTFTTHVEYFMQQLIQRDDKPGRRGMVSRRNSDGQSVTQFQYHAARRQ